MKLIAECKQWWRLWSVRLAAVAAALAATVVASPELLLGLLSFVPDGLRPVAAVLTAVVTFVLPTLARVMRQPKLSKGAEDGAE